ncbi:hypothetical protein NQZ68_011487 [Dissostichus eleginoides]|nr:hypothetical protein NQZ68_011487 [Dissostichus eleginoides]
MTKGGQSARLPLRASTQSLSDSRDKSSIQSGAGGGGGGGTLPAFLQLSGGRHLRGAGMSRMYQRTWDGETCRRTGGQT